MENAVDALKIAFAVMVFTIALTLAISTFSQARETSEAVLFMNDKTNYYSWEDEVNYSEDKRIVGIEAIIPTLYRYYKENYTVIFEGIDIYHIDSTTKKWIKDTGAGDEINYFDLNSEIKANCPWVGTVNDIKKNLDLFLDGTSKYPQPSQIDKISFGNTARFVTYGDGFIEEHQNDTFLEELGEYATDRTYGMTTINGVEYYGGGGIGQYMSSLSYSTEPVEGDYFNDFDMIYEDNGEKIVYEYRNGNEVHFNDTVIYITEPIRHERYAILYKDAQNVMEVLGITRENIADCIVFESGTGMTLEDVKATRRSVKDEDTYQDFLDRLFTLEMYEARPLTIAVGGQGSSVELVLTDGTVYVMDNFSMELYIAKNGESVFSDAVGTFSISGLVDEFDY